MAGTNKGYAPGSPWHIGQTLKYVGGNFQNQLWNARVDKALQDTNNFEGFNYKVPDMMTWGNMPQGKQRDQLAVKWLQDVVSAASPFVDKVRADKVAADAAAKAAAEKARLDADAAAKAAAEQKIVDARNFAYSSPGDLGNQATTPAKRKVIQSANSTISASGVRGLAGTSNTDSSVLLKILLGQ